MAVFSSPSAANNTMNRRLTYIHVVRTSTTKPGVTLCSANRPFRAEPQ